MRWSSWTFVHSEGLTDTLSRLIRKLNRRSGTLDMRIQRKEKGAPKPYSKRKIKSRATQENPSNP